MSKNITIQEGGVARSFGNVAKLQTSLQGGGSCCWVPEDETQLKTKHITENGTYEAKDDNAYGYSKVTVNVPGGSGSADSHGKPSGGDIKPGGAGSAVVGTDPETGNDVVVGVDEDGELVTTPVPSAIQIITPPAKTSYTAGEAMDYTGIVVAAKKRDGTTFTDARYTNGHIPMGELIFPVTEAPAVSSTTGESTSSLITNLQQPIKWCISFMAESAIRQWEYSVRGARIVLVANYGNSNAKVCILSDSPSCLVGGRLRQRNHPSDPWPEWSSQITYEPFEFPGPITINGSTVYSNSFNYWLGDAFVSANVPWYTTAPDSNSCWTVVYGDYTGGGTVNIPVKWTNPYTGDMHQDAFDITSTQSSGSGGTTVDNEGVSGTEGGF